MITFKCDACDKTAPAPTALWDMRTCPPLGWFSRRGLSPDRYEVLVVVCSQKCSGVYDKAEAEAVGQVWNKIVVTTDDEEFKGVFPIPVRR